MQEKRCDRCEVRQVRSGHQKKLEVVTEELPSSQGLESAAEERGRVWGLGRPKITQAQVGLRV